MLIHVDNPNQILKYNMPEGESILCFQDNTPYDLRNINFITRKGEILKVKMLKLPNYLFDKIEMLTYHKEINEP